jgi:hypothetical protein
MTGRFLALDYELTVIKPGYKPLIRSMPGLGRGCVKTLIFLIA